MLVLVDQDGVLADFESGFHTAWAVRHPEAPRIAVADRRAFRAVDDYPPEWRDRVRAVCSAKGFFRSLAPIPGALEALRAMLAEGIDVRICTAPLDAYEHCVLEKYQWIEDHLGREFTRRVVMTKDKTLVRGDWLIDDNPTIVGSRTPAWRHAIYDAPYNRAATGATRMTWADWRQTLSNG